MQIGLNCKSIPEKWVVRGGSNFMKFLGRINSQYGIYSNISGFYANRFYWIPDFNKPGTWEYSLELQQGYNVIALDDLEAYFESVATSNATKNNPDKESKSKKLSGFKLIRKYPGSPPVGHITIKKGSFFYISEHSFHYDTWFYENEDFWEPVYNKDEVIWKVKTIFNKPFELVIRQDSEELEIYNENESINISSLKKLDNALCSLHTVKVEHPFTVHTIDLGCKKGIFINQLKDIIKEWESLNKI